MGQTIADLERYRALRRALSKSTLNLDLYERYRAVYRGTSLDYSVEESVLPDCDFQESVWQKAPRAVDSNRLTVLGEVHLMELGYSGQSGVPDHFDLLTLRLLGRRMAQLIANRDSSAEAPKHWLRFNGELLDPEDSKLNFRIANTSKFKLGCQLKDRDLGINLSFSQGRALFRARHGQELRSYWRALLEDFRSRQHLANNLWGQKILGKPVCLLPQPERFEGFLWGLEDLFGRQIELDELRFLAETRSATDQSYFEIEGFGVHYRRCSDCGAIVEAAMASFSGDGQPQALRARREEIKEIFFSLVEDHRRCGHRARVDETVDLV